MSKSKRTAARRRQRDPGKEAFWRQRISLQQRSGLCIRAFCKRESLRESAFYFWRREVARRDGQARGKRIGPMRFVELRAASPVAAPEPVAASEPCGLIEVVLPRDRRMVIRGGVDPSLLRRVLAVLEDRPC